MGSDVTQPSGTEGADLVAPHWPEWSETAYVDGSKVALARGQEAGRGSTAGFSGAEAVPMSDGQGIAADELVTKYTSIGTNLEGLAAQHTAEAQGLALNGANHYGTKTILASLSEDHDAARDALIAAGMTAGVPQPKMQEVLDELKQATTTAAANVGQANQETHRTLTESINTGAALSAPPPNMPGGAGLPADIPSQLAPLLQMGTQGPQMASGAVGQLVSGLSGMTGAFVDPIGQLVSGAAQGGAPGAEGGLDAGGEGGSGAGAELVSDRDDDKAKSEPGREDAEKKDEPEREERPGEPPAPPEGSRSERDSVPATHLASSGNTVQMGSGATTHVSAGSALADAPAGAPAQAVPAAAAAGGHAMGGQAMGGALGGAMGGSLGLGAPAGPSQSAPRTVGPNGGGSRRDGDQSEFGGAAAAAAVAVAAVPVGFFEGGETSPDAGAEAMFGARILAHLAHQDSRLAAAAVAVFPMEMGVYAITCTPDALGALRGGVVAPHATMPLASLTSVPGEFRTAWAGMADPVVPLCDALKRGYLARPAVIVALRPPGAPAVDSDGVAVAEVSVEQLLATDPVDDAATVAEQLVAHEHIVPIIEGMADEWSVPSDMDLASAFGSMRARAWYETRDPEYVYAMAWWMVIEARTALAGGDTDHAAALAWQLLALPPAASLTA